LDPLESIKDEDEKDLYLSNEYLFKYIKTLSQGHDINIPKLYMFTNIFENAE